MENNGIDANPNNFDKSVSIMAAHLKGRFMYHQALRSNPKAQKTADAILAEWKVEGEFPMVPDAEIEWCADLKQYRIGKK